MKKPAQGGREKARSEAGLRLLKSQLDFWRVAWTIASMEPWLIAVLLKPLFSLLLFGVFGLGIRWMVHRWMPESKFKTMLLKHRGGKRDSLCR